MLRRALVASWRDYAAGGERVMPDDSARLACSGSAGSVLTPLINPAAARAWARLSANESAHGRDCEASSSCCWLIGLSQETTAARR